MEEYITEPCPKCGKMNITNQSVNDSGLGAYCCGCAGLVLDGKARVTLDPSNRNEITISCGNVLVTWDCQLDSDMWIVFNGTKFHLIPHYLTAKTWYRDLSTFFEENEQEE